jgi:predicted nucleic acid-binding protein
MLLLDASVWLATQNADEADHHAASQIIDGEQPLAALDLTLYEVANVALERWRSPARARDVLALVEAACDQILRADSHLMDRAITIARIYEEQRLSVYDATYAAAAELNDMVLVSGDYKDLVEPGLALSPEAALATGRG